MGTPVVFQTKIIRHYRALLQYLFLLGKMFCKNINHFKRKLAKTSIKKKKMFAGRYLVLLVTYY